MKLTRADLLDRLDLLGIPHETRDHAPIFTVAEGAPIKAAMPGGHSKNLFLKDKKNDLRLVTALAETTIDLVALGKRLGARGRLSFASADLMAGVLGVTPGTVTPFALAHSASAQLVDVIVDEAFFAFKQVWFHPLTNAASTAITPADLIRFIEACGHTPLRLPLSQIKRS